MAQFHIWMRWVDGEYVVSYKGMIIMYIFFYRSKLTRSLCDVVVFFLLLCSPTVADRFADISAHISTLQLHSNQGNSQ